MNFTIKDDVIYLKKNLHLFDESQKKINRYKLLYDKYPHSTFNEYKMNLYKNKIKLLEPEIELMQKKIIGEIEQIINMIVNYMKDLKYQNDILASERYHFLQHKNLHNCIVPYTNDNSIISTENQMEKITNIQKNINLFLNKIEYYNSKNKQVEKNTFIFEFNWLLAECNISINEQLTQDNSNNFYSKIKKILNNKNIELDELKKSLSKNKILTLDENELINYLKNKYNNIPSKIHIFFEILMPTITLNKKFCNKTIDGKKFILKYVNLYHSELIELINRFLNHYMMLTHIEFRI